MAREVRISDRAVRDLASIWQSLCAPGSEEGAHQSLRALGVAIRNLPFTPLGSPQKEDTGARERIVGRHILIYDVEPTDGVGPCAGHVNVLCIVGPGSAHDAEA
jgi:plasmid stabilization system protein ParE